ncbi:asparagine synthase-related protein [Solicola gregarius]|uniref:asparagine synthase (glutamine-hydrolyzing) n=1 Tax=Solicola gregarius TaxID=2908642 RepID=A0AA46TF77_9ACTN|nr:asparagine synthase-related protein [Solicola gregarius]UYM04083.1 asparagine synthase-related protein [Solicola gregarius]
MCGIVAIHDPVTTHAELGHQMLDRVRHRGPDGYGSRTVGDTWLGHTRLAIVDLADGDQPLGSDDGHWVVANGEIYNHSDLREDAGYAFRTRSDSEAALAAARSGSDDDLAELRGMFAFVVAHADGTVLAARDPLGVKPLYWVRDGSMTAFASELGAFDPQTRPHVEEFPPGFRWSPESGLARFRDLRTDVAPVESRDDAIAAIRSSFVDSVRYRMMGDVPVGVFLSGGLDSSLVAAVMARYADPSRGPIHSFAAGTKDSTDLAAARRVADHLGLEHHERVFGPDEVVAVLPDVVGCMESYEPSLVRSGVPNYLLSELASTTVKVVLTGEGADELFAGYDHLRAIDHEQLAEELIRSVEGLHNLNLQRCDRVTMAHGLEARVPFLDRSLVYLAQRIPIEWKLPRERGQEKALLREAFAGWLPDDILWRPKEQFGDGSGMADVMQREAYRVAADRDWQAVRVAGLPAPRSREELAYQRMFADHLEGVHPRVLGRFATA